MLVEVSGDVAVLTTVPNAVENCLGEHDFRPSCFNVRAEGEAMNKNSHLYRVRNRS
jgi:hypothetical protein